MKDEYDFTGKHRGAIVQRPADRVEIRLALKKQTLDLMNAYLESRGGGSYELLIDEAVAEWLTQHSSALDDKIRQLIREELDARSA